MEMAKSEYPSHSAMTRLLKMPVPAVASCIILSLCLLAMLSLLGVPLTAYNYDQTSEQILLAPSFIHWFGTDELGRDLLTRIIYGSRLSISIGLLVALIAFLFGTAYGAVA